MRLMMRDKRRNDAQLSFNQMEGFDTADDGIGIDASVERCKVAAVSAAYPEQNLSVVCRDDSKRFGLKKRLF
ncbi:hypothetical protein [Rhizobium gallicum]|uniref:hypothetical protein n=1 Tax=Rhizobium gallicum TaxID=56730 RepID=UPI001EF84F90|nr:hypothetical protein [Rhizobium gallicum]ULJ73194.1 hypothetical protein L2W42_06135 [Rhizobium gallicum]